MHRHGWLRALALVAAIAIVLFAAWGVAWTLAYVVVDALLVCVAVSLIAWAARGRWPRLQRLALLPGGALIAAALVLTAVLVPQLDEGRTPPDCDSFSFKRSAWRSSDVDTQLDTAYGVAHAM
ncbi:MAG: hypothetical protein M3N47_01090 [Chloroflexota bacterium]|nr:hypothetical protein [Chloroflexota bacterium]